MARVSDYFSELTPLIAHTSAAGFQPWLPSYSSGSMLPVFPNNARRLSIDVHHPSGGRCKRCHTNCRLPFVFPRIRDSRIRVEHGIGSPVLPRPNSWFRVRDPGRGRDRTRQRFLPHRLLIGAGVHRKQQSQADNERRYTLTPYVPPVLGLRMEATRCIVGKTVVRRAGGLYKGCPGSHRYPKPLLGAARPRSRMAPRAARYAMPPVQVSSGTEPVATKNHGRRNTPCLVTSACRSRGDAAECLAVYPVPESSRRKNGRSPDCGRGAYAAKNTVASLDNAMVPRKDHWAACQARLANWGHHRACSIGSSSTKVLRGA